MARKRNEKAIEAERLYKEEKLKLVDIAHQLDVPVGSVRRWKHDGRWDGDGLPKRERSDKEKANVRKKAEINECIESVIGNEELNEREQRFCLLFAQNPIATSAYKKAYGCSHEAACKNAWILLQKGKIKDEIARLKKIKLKNMLIDEADVVDKYMRIAFSDISDYVEWGTEEVPVMTKFGPAFEENEETAERKPIMRTINYVRFLPVNEVDGTLISEVKLGRDGASIKLLDPQKALEWLSKYFEIHPEDKRKREYEYNRDFMSESEKIPETRDAQVNIYLPDNNRDKKDDGHVT